jgi:hypothetical protein
MEGSMPVTRSVEIGRPETALMRELTRYVYEQAQGHEDLLHLAYVTCYVYRGFGAHGPRSHSADFSRGTSHDGPAFGDGWVIGVVPDHESTASALDQHLMFCSDEHLAEDREGWLASAAGGLLAFARRVPVRC